MTPTTLAALRVQAVETLNLVVNSHTGEKLLREAIEAGCVPKLQNVFIQPGAGGANLIQYCRVAGLHVHEGCVLLEL